MEYLLNFMERLEEGLGETAANVNTHMRVSEYQKKSGSGPSESFLTDSSDLANSTFAGSDAAGTDAEGDSEKKPSLAGYSHIEDSYF